MEILIDIDRIFKKKELEKLSLLHKNIHKHRQSIQLWALLSPAEKRSFEYWLKLQSKRGESQELKALNALKEAKPNKEDEAIRKAFGLPKENDGYLRTIHSRLSQKLRDFLVLLSVQQTDKKEQLLLEELNRRKAGHLFRKSYHKAQKTLNHKPYRTFSYYEQLYHLKAEYQRHMMLYAPKSHSIPFFEAYETFEYNWILRKLSLACYALSHAHLRKEWKEDALLPEIIQLLKSHPDYQSMPVIQFYLLFYEFLKEVGGHSLTKIRMAFQEHVDLFEADEKQNICTLILNQYIGQLEIRNAEASPEEIIDFYAWVIDVKVVFEGKYLPWDHYRNLLGLSLKYGLISRAKRYHKVYKSMLLPEFRHASYQFFEGMIAYREKNYKKARRRLRIRYDHPLLDIPAQVYYLQASYEGGFFDKKREKLIVELNRLAVFIEGEQNASFQKMRSHYLNQITFFLQLLDCHCEAQYRDLLKELNKCDALADKEWFIKQIRAKTPLS